jgi:hypothetical protein
MDSKTEQSDKLPFAVVSDLRKYLVKYTQLEVLRHFLGQPLPDAPKILDQAVFVGLDLEWWEHDRPQPSPITEVGLSVLRGKDLLTHGPNDTLLDLLKCVDVHHMRIIETCHFRNNILAPKAEDNFLFGETRFLKQDEAKNLLLSFLRGEAIDAENVPIILLGHGGTQLQSDKTQLSDCWKVSVMSTGNIVYTMTTSPLAHQAKVRAEELSGLPELLNGFGIFRGKCQPADKKGRIKREPRYDHNAGNDIAFTTLLTLLIGFFPRLFPGTVSGYPPLTSRVIKHENQTEEEVECVEIEGMMMPQLLEAFIDLEKAKATPTWGVPTYCFKGETTDHNYSSQCTCEITPCTFCSPVKGKHNKKIRDGAKNHPTHRCTIQYLPGKIESIALPTFIQTSQILGVREKDELKSEIMRGDDPEAVAKVGKLMVKLFAQAPPFERLGENKLLDEQMLQEAENQPGAKAMRSGIPQADAAARIRRLSTGRLNLTTQDALVDL